jgi:MFS family permease
MALDATPTGSATHRSTFVLLCSAVFVEAVGIGVLFPLLATVQRDHHLPTYGLGLMSGASFFAALIGQLGLAPFLDGRRARRVLIAGMVLGTVAPLWFAFGRGLISLTAARAVGGVASGIVTPAALRSGTAGVAEDRRGGRLGVLSSTQMAGIVLGPIVGVLL